MATQLVSFCDRGGNYLADGFELRRTIRTLPQKRGRGRFREGKFSFQKSLAILRAAGPLLGSAINGNRLARLCLLCP